MFWGFPIFPVFFWNFNNWESTGNQTTHHLSSSIQCFQTASNNTFKFSLPSRILRKQTTKEIIRWELAFHNCAYALLLYKSYSKNHHKLYSALLQKRFSWDEYMYSCLPNCSKQSNLLDPSTISLYLTIDENNDWGSKCMVQKVVRLADLQVFTAQAGFW